MRKSVVAIALCLLGIASPARAQYRLRADAFYTAADPSTGFVMLSSDVQARGWLEAESVVWLGVGSYAGDVLTASVRAHDPKNYAELRAGRFVMASGAMRPLHMDGAKVAIRAPWGTSLELFGGVPVVANYASRQYDWVIGGRVGQRVGGEVSVGMSYLQQRKTGQIAYEELGIDVAAAPWRYADLAGTAAIDLRSPALTNGKLSLGFRPLPSLRLELYATTRSPAHMLPATSLFSAIGDLPSTRGGGSLLWRAAPRLDFAVEGAAQSIGGELGYWLWSRSTLRLDNHGDRAVSFEVRRQGLGTESWTGFRATVRMPFTRWFMASTELELLKPDDPRGRGTVWPWGLVALRFKPDRAWEVAGAFEASSSPTSMASIAGFLRVSREWRGP